MQKLSDEDSRRTAQIAQLFLQRAQISGADADNYIAVRNWLTMIANGDLAVVAKAASPFPPMPSDQETAA